MLRNFTKYSAWLTYSSIVLLYIFSLWALFDHRGDDVWSFSEITHILKYSFIQAGLSATLSLAFGLCLARSFFYLEFKGKQVLYKILSFAWALPSLVVIFAVVGVWGNSGWLSIWSAYLGIEWLFQLYGLQGILLAHIFFNIPLVAKYCLEALNLIPSYQHKLGTQLNLTVWTYFRIIEFPTLKMVLPYAFSNVFLSCFTSFPIVLMLGGGPKYSTLEVAIYQAVAFEFDFTKAVGLIITQLLVGILLQLLMDWTTRRLFEQSKNEPPVDYIWKPEVAGITKVLLYFSLILASLMILLPLANTLWSGISTSKLLQRLANPILWEATLFSMLLSFISSIFVIAIAYVIALEARQLAYHKKKLKQSLIAGISTYPLVIPIFMLAVGLFLLFMEYELTTFQLILIVGVCNGLTLLPYVYRLIFSAMWQALVSHDKLALSLGLAGFTRWWIVETPYLIRPIKNAFALAMSSSLGSFSVIAFFGSPDFMTLPYLLYQQLGSYRMEDAAVTALVLMLLAFLPFIFIEHKETKV